MKLRQEKARDNDCHDQDAGKKNRLIQKPKHLYCLLLLCVTIATVVPACNSGKNQNSSNGNSSENRNAPLEHKSPQETGAKSESSKGVTIDRLNTDDKPFRFIHENAFLVLEFSPEKILELEGIIEVNLTPIEQMNENIRLATLQLVPAYNPIRLVPCWHVECNDASTATKLAVMLCPGQPNNPIDAVVYPSSKNRNLAVAYPNNTSFVLGEPQTLSELMFFDSQTEPVLQKKLNQVDESNHLRCVVDADRLRHFLTNQQWSRGIYAALDEIKDISAGWDFTRPNGLEIVIIPMGSTDQNLAASMVDFFKQQTRELIDYSQHMLKGNQLLIDECDRSFADLMSKLKASEKPSKFVVNSHDLEGAKSLLKLFSILHQLIGLTNLEETKSIEAQLLFRQTARDIHSYYCIYKRFPRDILNADKKPLLSWRVELCKVIAPKLYEQFQLDQPWDSLANKKLIMQMPLQFQSIRDGQGDSYSEYRGLTTIHQVVGKGTPLGDGKTFEEIEDGSSTTFMLVESAEPNPWTQPEDFDVVHDDVQTHLRNYRFIVARFDSAVDEIRTSPEPIDGISKAFGYDDGIWDNPNEIDDFDPDEWVVESSARQPPPRPDSEVQAILNRYSETRAKALNGEEDLNKLQSVLNDLRNHSRYLAHPMTDTVWSHLLKELDQCSPTFQLAVLDALRPWRVGAEVDFKLLAPLLQSKYDRIKVQTIRHCVNSNGKERAKALFELSNGFGVHVVEAFRDKHIEHGAEVAKEFFDDTSASVRFKALLWSLLYGNSSHIDEVSSRVNGLDSAKSKIIQQILDGKIGSEGQLNNLDDQTTYDELVNELKNTAHTIEFKGKSVRALKLANYDNEFNDRNQVTDKDLKLLSMLKGLEVLEIDSRLITNAGVTTLKRIRSLKELALRNCDRLRGLALENIGDLEDLERFSMSNGVSSIPELSFLKKLKRLRVLNLAEVRVHSKPFVELIDHEHLTELSFQKCRIFDSQLESIESKRSLRKLTLYGNPITDASIPALSKLKQLKELNLKSTFITDEGIKKLKLALPSCSIVD